MNAPFHLRKRLPSEPDALARASAEQSSVPGLRAQPADGLLLLSRAAAEVLEVCAKLGVDPLPRIYDVADGFLLLLEQPTSAIVPRTLRLRRRAPHLLIPADADLVPALHDDEASALVRDRGLVFLPGNRVLAFAPNEPLALAALIDPGPMRRTTWQPFPPSRPLADHIHSLTLDLPQPPPEVILESGAADIGSEDPRPEASGMLDRIAGNVQAGAGRGLMGLGNLFGLHGLANFGKRLVEGAMERVPRLSESVLGQQEAALRDLLRLFQSGDLDKALRRALPIGGSDRGGTAARDANLPVHSLSYSLSSIWGGGRGPATIWYGGQNVQVELAEQYRKAAEAAAQRGDYRRAAFIYGKLLQDYRRAADTLFHGGLYADAAVLYLKKLDDRAAAARAYELAGQTDRAVQLYRQLGDHAAAGDVLRRAGEEEKAVAEYCLAAGLLYGKDDFLGAAELMQVRAHRPDKAQSYLESGWERRPTGNSIACGQRLIQLHAERRDGGKLLEITSEARTFFDPPGHREPAREFYHKAATLAEGPGLDAVRDDVRDQALLGLAIKAEQDIAGTERAGDLVSRLFGTGGVFPTPVVSDAQFAVAAAYRQPRRARQPRPLTRVKLGNGYVSAACVAPTTGEVFVGYAGGQVISYEPHDNAWRHIACHVNEHVAITDLAAAPNGQFLVALTMRWDDTTGKVDTTTVTCYTRQPGGMSPAPPQLGDKYVFGLSQGIVERVSTWVWGTWNSFGIRQARYTILQPWCDWPEGLGVGSPLVSLQLPFAANGLTPTVLFFCKKSLWTLVKQAAESGTALCHETELGWQPGSPQHAWAQPPVSYVRSDDLELCGVDAEGVAHWSKLRFTAGGLKATAQLSAAVEKGYRAAAVVRSGLVAAVAADRVDWLRAGRSFQKVAETPGDLAGTVACFASLCTGELLVVTATSELVRVPLPG